MSTNVTEKPVYQTLDFLLTQGAVGSIAFTSNPVATKIISLNAANISFVASGAGLNQSNIGVDLATTMANLVTVLRASANGQIQKNWYWTDGATLFYATKLIGTSGNSFTTTTNVTGATASGATMANGGTWNVICTTNPTIVAQGLAAGQRAAAALWARQQNYSDSAWLNFDETVVGGGSFRRSTSLQDGLSLAFG